VVEPFAHRPALVPGLSVQQPYSCDAKGYSRNSSKHKPEGLSHVANVADAVFPGNLQPRPARFFQ
jgi:hypothetical protein